MGLVADSEHRRVYSLNTAASDVPDPVSSAPVRVQGGCGQLWSSPDGTVTPVNQAKTFLGVLFTLTSHSPFAYRFITGQQRQASSSRPDSSSLSMGFGYQEGEDLRAPGTCLLLNDPLRPPLSSNGRQGWPSAGCIRRWHPNRY